MNYKIVNSDSQSNGTIIENIILLECGISFTKLKKYYKKLKIVLLTHIHSDHFNKTCIKKLAKERPTLRFGCCSWLVKSLLECGVSKNNIDVYSVDYKYNYGSFKVEPFKLYHNVLNCGYKIYINDEKIIYATDTNKIETEAKDFDLYLIENNYTEEDLKLRIEQKELDDVEFIYEYRIPERHLSKEKADEFILNNIGDKGKYIYMHQHKEY